MHARAIRSNWLRLFTATVRGLLAFGFLLPGVVKLQGRFTNLPQTHRIGAFFEAFFQAREFYVFVGIAQIAAALFLLSRRTTTFGAVLYFPIILNIFVINVAIDFEGTELITGMMLLGCTYLLCWDYDRWKLLLPGFTPPASVDTARHLGIGYVAGASAAAGLLALGVFDLVAFGFDMPRVARSLLALVGGALIAAVVVARHRSRRDRSGAMLAHA